MMKNNRVKWLVAVLCAGLFCGARGWADNIVVGNVKVSDLAKEHHGTVRFNVQWENSWRVDLPGPGREEPYNYDAAWVFVKYRVGNGEWKHANLSTKVTDHVVPANCALSVGQTDGPSTALPPSLGSYGEARGAGKGVGVFLYRSANGAGTFAATNVGLRWEYSSNGLADGTAVAVKVFAIEMVYVPQGPFWVGDGLTNWGQFYEGNNKHQYFGTRGQFIGGIFQPEPPGVSRSPDGSIPVSSNATSLLGDTALSKSSPSPPFTPFRITNENEIAVGDSAGQLYYTPDWVGVSPRIHGDHTGPIPAAFPKGYAAFYGMKYELTQGQYVDFLNTLTSAQATNLMWRTPEWYAKLRSRRDARWNITESNGVYKTSLPYVGCGSLSWPNLLAYLDWAGLRPMTELEFEKACRGPLPPVPGEYAWGNTAIVRVKGTINDGLANEAPSNPDANCNARGLQSPNGPLRVGCMGIGSGDRTAMGAGYYGMMDLSGNVYEHAVSVGDVVSRRFTGQHGDGVLDDATGFAAVTGWPNAATLRGGDYYHFDSIYTSVSGRNGPYSVSRDSDQYDKTTNGGRGVRTAP